MKEQKYQYTFIQRKGNDGKELEKALNSVNTDKLLANVLELDYGYLIIWDN